MRIKKLISNYVISCIGSFSWQIARQIVTAQQQPQPQPQQQNNHNCSWVETK